MRHIETMDPQSEALMALDRIRGTLAENNDLALIKSIRDQAEAIYRFVKAAALGLELQNQVAEVKLVAERKAGQLLRKRRLHGGHKSGGRHDQVALKALGLS